jgi:hypothetical protein
VQRISAVQFVPARLGIRGFIEFTLSGGVERRATFGRRASTAAHDENSVLFGRDIAIYRTHGFFTAPVVTRSKLRSCDIENFFGAEPSTQ